MALDPETDRICMQPDEFDDGNLPRGRRGAGWPRREGEIEEEVWQAMMAGTLSGEDEDRIHREAWAQAEEVR